MHISMRESCTWVDVQLYSTTSPTDSGGLLLFIIQNCLKKYVLPGRSSPILHHPFPWNFAYECYFEFLHYVLFLAVLGKPMYPDLMQIFVLAIYKNTADLKVIYVADLLTTDLLM